MCLYPIKVWRYHDFQTGEVKMSFKRMSDYDDIISLPCGKCVECLQSYSTEWAVRCMLEAKCHKDICMITLTYKESDNSVWRRDLQLFIKRLRERLDVQIRYFGCGEYGKKGQRPHYHLIVFGWKPSDLTFFFERDGHSVYLSNFVSDVWHSGNEWKCLQRKPGFISVEDVTFQTCKYTAKYLQKLNTLPDNVNPVFTCMSLKPAIGLNGFDVKSFETDKVYLNGKQYSIPRYFRRKFNVDLGYDYRKRRGQLLSTTLISRRKLAKERFGLTRRVKP